MAPDDTETPGVDGLDSRDARLAALVAAGKTYEEAGAELGVSKSTVARAARDPEFRRAVDAIREHAIEAGLGVLCSAFAAAAGELARLVREGTPADAIRLGAARTVIESVLKVRDQVEVIRRLNDLEERSRPKTLEESRERLRQLGFDVDRFTPPPRRTPLPDPGSGNGTSPPMPPSSRPPADPDRASGA
jgi:predicted transcriptional regulator